jgi:transcription-repair coupling factor (superfamily II helicase)
LHQLRGRVGRSHHQAYAYLLTHDDAALNKQARQRLEAIQMMDELGAGFYLAMHDLEIRGAGEVLGDSQSGEMQEVGFNLFTEMLNRAVAALKQGKEPDLLQPLAIATEIKLHTPALLPNDYAPDVHERLTLYKRLADCTTGDDIGRCRKNWSIALASCRAGAGPARQPPPAPALQAARHQQARRHGEQIVVQFEAEPPIDPMRIINLIQTDRNYRLAGQDKLILKRHCCDACRPRRRGQGHHSSTEPPAKTMTPFRHRQHQRQRLRPHAFAGGNPRPPAAFGEPPHAWS